MLEIDSEVLTKNGYRRIEEVKKGDMLLGLIGEKARWVVVEGMIEQDHNNYVYAITNGVEVTEDNRLWAKKETDEAYRSYDLDDLRGCTFSVNSAIDREIVRSDCKGSVIEFLGWMAAHGQIKEGKCFLNIDINLNYLLDHELGMKVRFVNGLYEIDDPLLTEWVISMLGKDLNNLSSLFDYSDDLLKEFYFDFNTTSSLLIEQYSILLAMLGKGSEVDSRGVLRVFPKPEILVTEQHCCKYSGKVYRPSVNANVIYSKQFWIGL